MNLGLRSILLIVAIVLFVLAAIGVGLGDISLVPLGLAFFGAGLLVAMLIGAVGLLAETVRVHRTEARLPRT